MQEPKKLLQCVNVINRNENTRLYYLNANTQTALIKHVKSQIKKSLTPAWLKRSLRRKTDGCL